MEELNDTFHQRLQPTRILQQPLPSFPQVSCQDLQPSLLQALSHPTCALHPFPRSVIKTPRIAPEIRSVLQHKMPAAALRLFLENWAKIKHITWFLQTRQPGRKQRPFQSTRPRPRVPNWQAWVCGARGPALPSPVGPALSTSPPGSPGSPGRLHSHFTEEKAESERYLVNSRQSKSINTVLAKTLLQVSHLQITNTATAEAAR